MVYNIQVLRAVAALLVVFAHMDRLIAPLAGGQPPNLTFATSGVDLFFVISGFVMVHTSIRRPISPGDFALNRVIRIVPLYWLLTIIVFGLAALAPSLLGATRASFSELLQSLFFIPYEKGNGLVQPVLFLGWTLNYEMFFYLLFALALWVCGGRIGRVVPAVASVLALLVLAGWWLQPTGTLAAFYTNSLLLEFAMGMAIGLLHQRRLPIPSLLAAALVAIGFVAMLGSSFLTDMVAPVLLRGLPASLIVIGMLALERNGATLRAGWLQLLGGASYAMYLIHPFLLRPIEKLTGPFASIPLTLPILVLALAVVIGASVAMHLWVELPITHRLRRKSGHAPSVVDRAEAAAVGEGLRQSNA